MSSVSALWRGDILADTSTSKNGRYVTFQMAEVAISKNLFADIPQLIAEIQPPPDPAMA